MVSAPAHFSVTAPFEVYLISCSPRSCFPETAFGPTFVKAALPAFCDCQCQSHRARALVDEGHRFQQQQTCGWHASLGRKDGEGTSKANLQVQVKTPPRALRRSKKEMLNEYLRRCPA